MRTYSSNQLRQILHWKIASLRQAAKNCASAVNMTCVGEAELPLNTPRYRISSVASVFFGVSDLHFGWLRLWDYHPTRSADWVHEKFMTSVRPAQKPMTLHGLAPQWPSTWPSIAMALVCFVLKTRFGLPSQTKEVDILVPTCSWSKLENGWLEASVAAKSQAQARYRAFSPQWNVAFLPQDWQVSHQDPGHPRSSRTPRN